MVWNVKHSFMNVTFRRNQDVGWCTRARNTKKKT